LKDDYPLAGSTYDDDDDEEEGEWGGDDTTWTEEEGAEDDAEGKDESSAYLDFLNEEVPDLDSHLHQELHLMYNQVQKFGNLEDVDSDDELNEESLLETPLDKVEPYGLFRDALLSTFYHS
jgi:hypothetical protein